MDITQYRKQIDEIDSQLLVLFHQRMEISAQIAAYKQAHHLPIFVPERELEKLAAVSTAASPEMSPYVRDLFATLFALSKRYQEACTLTDATK